MCAGQVCCQTRQHIGWAKDVEDLRFALWRRYLSRLITAAEHTHDPVCFLSDVGIQRVERLSRVLLSLDRANVLHVMKINLGDPCCPRGMAWLTHESLDDFQKSSSSTTELAVNGVAQRESIDKQWTLLHKWSVLASDTDGSWPLYLRSMLTPQVPEWMCGEEHEHLGFRRLYQYVREAHK